MGSAEKCVQHYQKTRCFTPSSGNEGLLRVKKKRSGVWYNYKGQLHHGKSYSERQSYVVESWFFNDLYSSIVMEASQWITLLTLLMSIDDYTPETINWDEADQN